MIAMPRKKFSKNKTSKFILLYGKTLKQIARDLRVSPYKAYMLHIAGELKPVNGQKFKCSDPTKRK